MTLDELKQVLGQEKAREVATGRSFIDIGGREKLAPLAGSPVKLIVNEWGRVEYKIVKRDAHLGAREL
jgi:hypothetical protein